MDARRVLMGCFIVSVLSISWYSVKACHKLPFPARYITTGIAFGMLDLFSLAIGDELPSVIGVGLTIAAIMDKGFTVGCSSSDPNCCQPTCGTAQPAAFLTLTGTSNTSPQGVQGQGGPGGPGTQGDTLT